MRSSTARRFGIGSLTLAVALGLGACASPTAPKLPEPDDDKNPPKDDDGSSARRWSADFRATMSLLVIA